MMQPNKENSRPNDTSPYQLPVDSPDQTLVNSSNMQGNFPLSGFLTTPEVTKENINNSTLALSYSSDKLGCGLEAISTPSPGTPPRKKRPLTPERQ